MIAESKTCFSEYPRHSTIEKLLPAVRILLRKLQIKTLPKSEMSDMILYSYKKDTYPGFSFDKYLQKRPKGDCFNEALYIATKRWENIDNKTSKGETVKREDLFPSTYFHRLITLALKIGGIMNMK